MTLGTPKSVKTCVNTTNVVLMIPYRAPGMGMVRNALNFDVFKTSAASYSLESDKDKEVLKIIRAWGNVQ